MTIQIGDVVGDYKVIGIAGSGGMGEVYKIEHILTKRVEAMKLLPANLSTEPDQVQRFEREMQVQARLHHPNVVALYNAVRKGGAMALVMEFVEGESLQRVLEHGALPVGVAVNYARQVLSALAYAHEAGVIHRDVAPANIIITPDRVVKLTDFGLARADTDLRLTSSGVPVGSPWYMSPEQVRGVGVIDGRTDLYAVGAVLHEMLTGAKLFDVDGAFAVMRAQVEAEPLLPSSRNPAIPAALDEIIHKALAKNPDMRFQTADEFRGALEKAVPEAAPAVIPQRPKWSARWVGFHPSRAAVVAAVVPVGLAAAFFRVQFFPKTVHAPAAVQRPVRPAVAEQVVAPVPVAPVAPTPETAVIEAAPQAPAPLPVSRTRAVVVPPAPEPAPVRTVHQPVKPARSYAIRVTGAEIEPADASPAPAAVRANPASERDEEKAVAVESASGVREAAASDAAAQEVASPKSQKPGNRFVRALGKINPFKKGAKDDSAEPAKAGAGASKN